MIRMRKRPAEAKDGKGGEASENGTASGAAGESNGAKVFGVASSRRAGAKSSSARRATPGELRVQKDIAELDVGGVAKVEFPDKNKLTEFNVNVTPDTGMWRGATYKFAFSIPRNYPHDAPKVECETKIYHPNINLEGKVCLNILREDWKPVLDLSAVIYGIIYLFYEPNPDDPLNHEAADVYRRDPTSFQRQVQRTLRGDSLVIDGRRVPFPRLL